MSEGLRRGNLLWEGSRMMLPEHKEAYLAHRRDTQKKSRPELDDQEEERLSLLIAHAMQSGKDVTIVLFGSFEERTLTGTVTKIDRRQGVVKLRLRDGDMESIPASDIMNVLAGDAEDSAGDGPDTDPDDFSTSDSPPTRGK